MKTTPSLLSPKRNAFLFAPLALLWCLAVSFLSAAGYGADTFDVTGSLHDARGNHTATLLPNGKVLVAGGYGPAGQIGYLITAELYDPASGTWSATGSLANARMGHTATLLPNGKVLVAGGKGPSAVPDYSGMGAELYDPASGTWSLTGSLSWPRADHTATLLPNGKVLVVGGASDVDRIGELYDPALGTWSDTDYMADVRSHHTATLLPNGKVLVAGGYGPGGTSGYLSTAELVRAVSAAISPPRSFTIQPAPLGAPSAPWPMRAIITPPRC